MVRPVRFLRTSESQSKDRYIIKKGFFPIKKFLKINHARETKVHVVYNSAFKSNGFYRKPLILFLQIQNNHFLFTSFFFKPNKDLLMAKTDSCLSVSRLNKMQK